MTPTVIFITDPRFELAHTLEMIRAAAATLGPDGLLVQLRDKTLDEDQLLTTARAVVAVARRVRARVVINGPAANASIAHAASADGLHIPAATTLDLSSAVAAVRSVLGDAAFITTSAHDDDDVRRASEAGATGVLVSPIFETPGKGAPRGVAALAAARSIVDAMRRVPPLLVYALGGVTAANAASCTLSGADGVAAIRAFYDAPLRLPLPVAVRGDEC